MNLKIKLTNDKNSAVNKKIITKILGPKPK